MAQKTGREKAIEDRKARQARSIPD